MGKKTPRWGKIWNSLNNRCLTNWGANTILTNVNTVGTDNAWILMPVAGIKQTSQAQTAAAGEIAALPQDQFTGINIYLRGIKLDYLVVSEASQDFFIRVMCFWVHQDVDVLNLTTGAGNAWLNWTNTGVAGNTIGGSKFGQGVINPFNFLDLPYDPASNYGNFSNITARPNPNYPGKLLYDFKKKLTCTANITSAGGNPSFHYSTYLPFNQLFTFATYPFQAQSFDTTIPNLESLDVAPNFGKHGQPIFVIYYANTVDVPSAGTESSINISGTVRTYFKDIGA